MLTEGAVQHNLLLSVDWTCDRLGDAQWFWQRVSKIWQLGVLDELRCLWVPNLAEHLKVVLAQQLCALLCGHAEVLQDDGDVHVHHDEEGDDDVGDEEGDAHWRVPTIPSDGGASVGDVGVALLWGVVEDGAEQAVPAGRGGDLEQADHTVPKCLKVEHVVNPCLPLHVSEVGHAEDGVNEHDEEEEEPDVKESRKQHHKGK